MRIAPLEIQRGLTEISVRSNCRFCLFKNSINDHDMFNYFGHCPVGYQTCKFVEYVACMCSSEIRSIDAERCFVWISLAPYGPILALFRSHRTYYILVIGECIQP